MLTARALLFGFVGLCFYLIAFVNGLPTFYYALTWLSAAVLASCLGTALLSLFGVGCTWTVESAVVSEAPERTERRVVSFFVDEDEDETLDEELVEWDSSGHGGLQVTLVNRGTFNKTDLTIEVQLHEVTRDQRLVRAFLIEALPSGSQIAVTLPLHDLQRGRYRVISVLLRGSDVLGLFRFRKTIPSQQNPATWVESQPENKSQLENNGVVRENLSAQIVVGPAMLGLEDVRGRGLAGAVSGAAGGRRSSGRGDEFSGTRPYVVGDDLRLVHWKSTARRGEFVVREWERTTQDQTLVIWDGAVPTARERARQRQILRALQLGKIGAQFKLLQNWEAKRLAAHQQAETAEARVKSQSKEARAVDEWALRLTASLCRILSENGRSCGLLRLDAHPYLLPPVQGAVSAQLLARVQEILSYARAERSSPLSAALMAALRAPRIGHIYLVTASTSPDLIEAVRWLQRQRTSVIVCLVDGAVFDGSAVRDARKRRGSRQVRDEYAEQEERLKRVGISVLRLPQRPQSARSRLPFRVEDDGIPGGAQQMQLLQEALQKVLQFRSSPTGRAVMGEMPTNETSAAQSAV